MKFRKILYIGLICLLTLVYVNGLTLAADNSTNANSGMEFSTGTFTKDVSWSAVDSLKPLAGLIISVALFIYGLTLLAGPIGSGITINAATFTKSNDLRSEGQQGILHVIIGLLLVCVALIAIKVLWNNFGPGSLF